MKLWVIPQTAVLNYKTRKTYIYARCIWSICTFDQTLAVTLLQNDKRGSAFGQKHRLTKCALNLHHTWLHCIELTGLGLGLELWLTVNLNSTLILTLTLPTVINLGLLRNDQSIMLMPLPKGSCYPCFSWSQHQIKSRRVIAKLQPMSITSDQQSNTHSQLGSHTHRKTWTNRNTVTIRAVSHRCFTTYTGQA